MPKPAKYSERLRTEICTEYLSGISPAEISRQFAVPISSVNNILSRGGVQRRGGGVRELIIKHGLLGQTAKEIAAEIGCHESYARNVIRECGLRYWP